MVQLRRMVPVHTHHVAGEQVTEPVIDEPWFEQGVTYHSLNKPGECVHVYSNWQTMNGARYAAGVWVLGPRSGDSWSRTERDDIFHAYEKVEANPWGTDNQTSTLPTPMDQGTRHRHPWCKCGCSPPKTPKP